ncbi:hypothetical protein N7517_000465 [Penicillium concentricum]|uniref:Dextranase n=1 Tax=Penicillium concentricum TaxID=293559 RepID=A0A9W9VIZ0_9EURO|nr:uncharacterized protein N7517_000465 [Penicillium concentricum]KAJ5382554.1 hypothetical protein N7517_000465 [Penicillium concentricum]
MQIIHRIGLVALTSIFFQATALAVPYHTLHKRATNIPAITASGEDLQTWWHTTGVINTNSPVADESVRQSHKYSVQVSTDDDGTFYDSFVYETIPRSGKGKLCYPDKPDICNDDDQIAVEADIGVTMGWTQFLYASDVVVKVTRLDGKAVSPDDVTIRPTNRKFTVTTSENAALIRVPYTPETNGVRFSVEFADDIIEYRTRELASQSHYVQDVNNAAPNYVDTYTDTMPIVGREPLNALLIFASPFPSNDMVPSKKDDIYEVKPGLVESLENVDKSIVSFGPGVYWFTGKNRAVLSSSVSWVYLAPGSYVKGAIEYNNSQSPLKATGFGVLSGEQYVYQANTADGYRNSKSDQTSLKMWRGNGVSSGQTWTMNGITTNAAPFNVMDFYGDNDSTPPNGFSVDVSDYKQVGSFYGQTDGLQMYTNGHLRDVFYHTGDDGIKAYYSGVLAERVIVWKTNNAPIIQLGWYPRALKNIHIDHLDIIHSRYYSFLGYAPRAIIGSSSSYVNTDATNTADVTTTISNFTVSNIRSEGISPGLISLNMLSNIENFKIENAWIEEFSPVPQLGTSAIVGFTDANHDNQKVALGSSSDGASMGLTISGYKVGNTAISFEAGNWDATQAGRLDVDQAYSGKWTVQ